MDNVPAVVEQAPEVTSIEIGVFRQDRDAAVQVRVNGVLRDFTPVEEALHALGSKAYHVGREAYLSYKQATRLFWMSAACNVVLIAVIWFK